MTIEERFTQLERINRNLRTGLVSLAIVFATVLIVGQAKPEKGPELLTVQGLNIVNGKGVVVLRLAATSEGDGELTLMDETGSKDLVQLTTTSKGDGMITSRNREGHRIVNISAMSSGQGVLSTYNGHESETALVHLGIGTGFDGPYDEPIGQVTTYGFEGNKRVELGGAMSDTNLPGAYVAAGGVKTYARDGKVLVELGGFRSQGNNHGYVKVNASNSFAGVNYVTLGGHVSAFQVNMREVGNIFWWQPKVGLSQIKGFPVQPKAGSD